MATKITESENNEINNNNHKDSQDNILNQKKSSIDNDLLYVEASEETMEGFTLPKEFLKLDLDKIREFIEIFEEYYQNLLEQENLSLAKSVKQRLILLKNLEKEKMKKEAKIIYSNQRELVQDKMNEELSSYIETTNTEFDSLMQAFESQEVEMLKTQKQELDEFKNNFEKLYENKTPKPSKQILNWKKIRDYAVKQNKFDKVEEASKEINKLQKKEMEKFELEKEKKLNIELIKIIRRHDNEKNALQMKKNSIVDMFNQTKEKNIEQIQKKYEAKIKELKNYQNFEMANFDKITKGIAKPCARIQCIVSSTTGIQEDENDENDENNNEIKGGEEELEEEEGEDKNNENQNKNDENGENGENVEKMENNNENENNEEQEHQENDNEHEHENEQEVEQEEKNEGEEGKNEHQGFEYEENEENDENVNEEYEEENMVNEEHFQE
jgi:hypothetical protein